MAGSTFGGTDSPVLSWRGMLAAFILFGDMLMLFGRVSLIPFWFRTHWAAESIWIFLSFELIVHGLDELCAVGEPWLGEPHTVEIDTLHDQWLVALFAGLAFVHIVSVIFAPSAQRRRLAALGAVIATITCHAHYLLDRRAALRLTGTYGRAFEPLRNLLWAHTSPGLALIVSGPSMLPMCETNQVMNRNIVAIMGAGFLATAAVPSSLTYHLGSVGLWGWRGIWLALSLGTMARSIYLVYHSILRQNATVYVRYGLCALVVASWSVFPLVWLLVHSHLISDRLESQLLGLGDFFAKQLAAVILTQGASISADAVFQDKQRSLLNYERGRVGMLQTFARSMGHDLRTPLQALIFSLHMSEASIRQLVARKKLPYQDGQMALDRIRRSSSCAELLSLIVSNLWELDSLEQPTSSSSTKVLLPNEQIDRMDLRSRFAAMVDLLKTSPQAKSHVLLQLVVDERLPIVMCDASRLTRALLNLMVNSLKFTSEGAVTLSITMLEKSESHVTVRFEVSDTGRGMTETQISCVTRAYVRSPADEEGGMGLGLAIVVQAVASLGSNLVITSPGLGYGSTCAFTLQMKTALDEEPSDKRVAEDEPPMRVLLADDVDLILDGARSVITDMGHKVVYTASDGEALLKTLVDHADEIDIAFVDIRMPKLFGDAAVAQYRSWEREHRTHAPPLRIYGASGDATASTLRQTMACGFDCILAKPVYPKTYEHLCRRNPLPNIPGAVSFANTTPTSGTSRGNTTPTEFSFDEDSFKSRLSSDSPFMEGGRPRESPIGTSPASSSIDPEKGQPGAWGWDTRAVGRGGKQREDKVAVRMSKAQKHLPDEIIDSRGMVIDLGFPVPVAIELVQQFQSYLGKIVEEMRQCESDNEWKMTKGSTTKTVSGIAHQVKGAALQVGAKRLIAASAKLEKAAIEGKSDRACAALGTWYATTNEVAQVLKTSSFEKLFEGPILAKPIEITTDEVRSAREEVRAIVQEAQKALSASYDDQLLKLESIVAALGD